MSQTASPDNPSTAEWAQAYARTTGELAGQLSAWIDTQSATLAASFYRELLARPDASRLISAEVLNHRLLPAIQRWMLFLFDPVNVASPSPTIALQRHVGEVHARMGIPLPWVSQGFRDFKRELNRLLARLPWPETQRLSASVYAGELLDLAQAEMLGAQAACIPVSQPGTVSASGLPGAGPAIEDVEAQRSRQLVALSDEESRFLSTMLSHVASTEVAALGSSPFGLWLQHKAPMLFVEAAEGDALARMSQTIDRLDTEVLPRLQASLSAPGGSVADLGPLLREVVLGLEDIRAALNQLFDRLSGAGGYRDALTQLFNRPLLAALLRREMELARRKRSSFSVLLVDIDHFSQVNDAHGHAAGDRVLQHVASLLSAQVRSSDFVFRYGGEEFLILLVELDAAQSLAVAEKIRRTVEHADIPLGNDTSLHITLSLGVALYNGQSDPQSITALADEALGRAKGSGRNRVVMAPA